MYHGNQQAREDIFKTKMMRNLKSGRPTEKFPVVCTSYEMVLRDQHNLSRINWEFIIIVRRHFVTHDPWGQRRLLTHKPRMKAIA